MIEPFDFKSIIDDEVSRLILAFLEGDQLDGLPKTAHVLDLLVTVALARALTPSSS